MTLTFPAYSTVTEIQHHFACAGFSRDVAATALRNDQSFHHNHKKTQEGNQQ
ncbi:hypothetical protein [Mesorhizobium sp. NZP2298]|uniref:hypothetical protein n=1 Tax=Mesorhizobium sp. NZP2298 TaxID=2483403 RepID=UPI001551B755|nr:hypothetical protein [Mesorhizobium sp. NZP2298]